MNKDGITPERPPEIYVFEPIGSQQAMLLAERISVHFTLYEDEEGVELLIRLLVGICGHCSEAPKCHTPYAAWRALLVLFAATQKCNDAFFDYVVRDLKIARDYREEGDEPAGEQSKSKPEREMYFESTLARIAYIIGKTRFLLSDQCEIADDEALGRIRDLVLEMDWRKESER
jgi:hypothetical protein